MIPSISKLPFPIKLVAIPITNLILETLLLRHHYYHHYYNHDSHLD